VLNKTFQYAANAQVPAVAALIVDSDAGAANQDVYAIRVPHRCQSRLRLLERVLHSDLVATVQMSKTGLAAS
jgi:hypothetical protein